MFWTKLHVYLLVPSFIIFILAAWFIGYKLKDKSERIQRLPLQIVTGLILILELWKQIRGFIVGYDLYWIPLHFCSLFLYTLPLAAYYNGKHKEALKVLAGIVASCLFLFMAVYPNIVYGDGAIVSAYNYITFQGGGFSEFHSVTFHGLALFSFFLFVFQNICTFDTKRDLKVLLIFFLGYCLIVGTLSQVIQTNFNNFYHSNAPFLEDFRLSMIDKLGYGGQIIYVLMISAGTLVVPTLAYFVLRGLSYLNRKYLIKK